MECLGGKSGEVEGEVDEGDEGEVAQDEGGPNRPTCS